MDGGAAVRTAVIPVAGLGTRLLPATKAVPKGLLPVIDRPAVQYVAEEAIAAGLTSIVLVTGPGQDGFKTYFGSAGTETGIDAGASVTFAIQDEPRGLADAVLEAAGQVGSEPFAVLLGDNILTAGSGLLAAMIAARERYGGTIVALTRADPGDSAARYPVSLEPAGPDGVARITNLASMPRPASGSSDWIMIGRFICDPAIFPVLRDTPPGHGGEIQFSDVLSTLAGTSPEVGGGVYGLLYDGRRLDTGTTQQFLRTTIELACTRPDIAPQFVPWLRRYCRA